MNVNSSQLQKTFDGTNEKHYMKPSNTSNCPFLCVFVCLCLCICLYLLTYSVQYRIAYTYIWETSWEMKSGNSSNCQWLQIHRGPIIANISSIYWYARIQHTTRSRLMSWFQSRKWVKVKVVKLCFKKWNGHILMHIYHIQCEFIQKNQWKGSNGQIHCFCKGNQLRGAKNLEN